MGAKARQWIVDRYSKNAVIASLRSGDQASCSELGLANMGDGLALVTGATGAVGPQVVAALQDAGYRVRTLSLDAPQPGLLPEDVDIHTGDVTDPSAVQSAMQGVDAVIHMAALLHIVEPPPAMREVYQRINVGGTATIVEAAVREGVKRVVLFSTIAVYGDARRQILTEEVAPLPGTFYARTKLAAERIVLDALGPDGQPLGVALRLGAVYGSRIKGNYRRLVQSLANGRFVPVGDGRNRRTLIYDKDVARAAVLVMRHPAAAGRVYNVSDGQFHTMRGNHPSHLRGAGAHSTAFCAAGWACASGGRISGRCCTAGRP